MVGVKHTSEFDLVWRKVLFFAAPSFLEVSVNMHSLEKKKPLVMSQKAGSQSYFCCCKRLLKMLFSVHNWKIGLPLLLSRSPGGTVLEMSVGLFLFFKLLLRVLE